MKKFVLYTLLGTILLSSCQEAKPDEDITSSTIDVDTKTVAFYGGFVGSTEHPSTRGTASINADGTALSFTNFKSDSGPELEVWVATSKTPRAPGTRSDYRSLGALKGLSGDYTYDLPSENIDYTQYKYVLIWCVKFSVSFGEAELASQTVNGRLE